MHRKSTGTTTTARAFPVRPDPPDHHHGPPLAGRALFDSDEFERRRAKKHVQQSQVWITRHLVLISVAVFLVLLALIGRSTGEHHSPKTKNKSRKSNAAPAVSSSSSQLVEDAVINVAKGANQVGQWVDHGAEALQDMLGGSSADADESSHDGENNDHKSSSGSEDDEEKESSSSSDGDNQDDEEKDSLDMDDEKDDNSGDDGNDEEDDSAENDETTPKRMINIQGKLISSGKNNLRKRSDGDESSSPQKISGSGDENDEETADDSNDNDEKGTPNLSGSGDADEEEEDNQNSNDNSNDEAEEE